MPESFPGVLRISTNLKGKPFLNEKYRDFGEDGNPEYEYFVKNLLSEITPTRTKYRNDECCQKTLSQAFTPTDEAFGLMVLDNELHVWDYQLSLKAAGEAISSRDPGNRKKYTNLYQKKKCGWKDVGLCYYTLLVNEVNEIRKKKQACENKYFNKFRKDRGYNTTASVLMEEDEEEAQARKLLATTFLPHEDELMERPFG